MASRSAERRFFSSSARVLPWELTPGISCTHPIHQPSSLRRTALKVCNFISENSATRAVARQRSSSGNEAVQFLHDGGKPFTTGQGFGAGASALVGEGRTGEEAGVERDVFCLGHGGG